MNGARLAYRALTIAQPNINLIRTPKRKAQAMRSIDAGIRDGKRKAKR